MRTTWDGMPIHPEKPHGATVVVYRRRRRGLEFLLLHRAHYGPDYEGDWAWTPPSGARQPGETIEACARRELEEETGLRLEPVLTAFGSEDWAVFRSAMKGAAKVILSAEHDRYAWLQAREAIARCKPELVALPIKMLSEAL